MERLKVDKKEAERTVDDLDHSRRQYVKTYYRRTWDDPNNYHLILNSDRLSYDEIAEVVAATVRVRRWK